MHSPWTASNAMKYQPERESNYEAKLLPLSIVLPALTALAALML